MRVRRLDKNHDWTFGNGIMNYADKSEAIKQVVKTRLWSFVDDWFLDMEHGLPWFEFMENPQKINELEVPIMAYILATEGIKKVNNFKVYFESESRRLIVEFSYVDIYDSEHLIDNRI